MLENMTEHYPIIMIRIKECMGRYPTSGSILVSRGGGGGGWLITAGGGLYICVFLVFISGMNVFFSQNPLWWWSIHGSCFYFILYEHLSSAIFQDEPSALHSGYYAALFSASEQSHCTLVIHNSEWVSVFKNSTSEWANVPKNSMCWSKNWLLVVLMWTFAQTFNLMLE